MKVGLAFVLLVAAFGRNEAETVVDDMVIIEGKWSFYLVRMELHKALRIMYMVAEVHYASEKIIFRQLKATEREMAVFAEFPTKTAFFPLL